MWEFATGIFTLIFLLAAFYFVIIAGLRETGKRGWLLIVATAFLGPGFVFNLVSNFYHNDTASLLSHGFILLASILFLFSFYLSKLELEREGGTTE
jgi:hypothetical protein